MASWNIWISLEILVRKGTKIKTQQMWKIRIISYLVYCHLYLFSRDAVTKYHRLGGLNNKDFLSYDSGGYTSEIRVSAGLVSSEAFLLGLLMILFSLSSLDLSLGSVLVLISFYQTTVIWIKAHPNDFILPSLSL